MTKQSIIKILLFILISMMGANAFAYDIAVENTDGVTIYYNFINDASELEVTSNYYESYTGNVVIPNEVTYMNKSYKVTSIEFATFHECTALTSVSIPNSVISIGDVAFSGCSNLTSITIPNSVITIGDGAFSGCSNLTSITIPNSVISIGDVAFSGCSGLTSMIVESGNSNYDSRDKCNAIIETASNTLIAGCKTTIISNSVTSIGESAFNGCSGLISITIPNSVTSIGNGAFSGCSDLTYVSLGQNVTSIGNETFFGCTSLTSIIIPNSVTRIGAGAFYNCSSLTTVTFNNSMTSIGGSAFRNCSSLTSVNFGNSVTGINNSAFNGCSGLTSIIIPKSVTSIGLRVFQGCSNLTSIIVEENNSNYDSRDNCNAIIETASNTLIAGCKTTIIPNSVTSIGESAFNGCSGPTSITIPNSVVSIGIEAFYGCSGLAFVNVGNSVENIGTKAFSGCSGLVSIIVDSGNNNYDSRDNCNAIIETASNTLIAGCKTTIIPNSVRSIGESAFFECSSLTSITIPNSVTSIGDYAFIVCSGLTSVTIPNSVTSIGKRAFYAIDMQTVVSLIENPFVIPESSTTFGRNTFNDATLYVPVGTIDKYRVTEGWKDFVHIVEGIPSGIFLSNKNEIINEIERFSLDGKANKGLYRGVNIIRTKDGKAKKIIVK